MKLKFLSLIFFLLTIFLIDIISAKTYFSLVGKVIVIDPGHAGKVYTLVYKISSHIA